DELAELAMTELRRAAVAIGVLVPEEALVVAGPADLDGLTERHQLTRGIEHEVHLLADPLPDSVDVGDLLTGRRIAPAVDLECGEAALEALLGEARARLRARQPVGLVVAVVGAGVAGESIAIAAE